jgi:hypothetical protein
MTGYVPKVGDKVRATLGENVLVASVIRVGPNGDVEVCVLPMKPVQHAWSVGDWHLEQLVSVPTKFGAVIRRADGEVYVLAEPDSGDAVEWFGREAGWATEHTATEGGFTVLFEGVDE